jgi:hypothetical protein
MTAALLRGLHFQKGKAFVSGRRRLFFTIDKALNPKHPG